MPLLKIGIIGVGYIGNVHASILSRDERVTLAAVYDVDQTAATRLASSTSASVVEDATTLIEAVDVVYITTPNTKHTELALQAIAAGKHVFCEKPMATSLAEAKTIVDAARQSERVVQVGHNRRFAPVYATLKRMLNDTHRSHSAHVKMNRGELLNPKWTGDPVVTGGFLYETTIHMFDMMRFLFGEVATLQAAGSIHEYPEVDDFSMLLTFTSGMHATFASSADASWMFPFERVEVFSQHATIVTREMESLAFTEGLDGKITEQSMHQLPKEEKWGYAQENQSFIDSILRGTEPAVTVVDGYKSVELVEACYESVRTGKKIHCGNLRR